MTDAQLDARKGKCQEGYEMETTSTIALTQDEINALTKLILYIKFESDDIETLLYSASPFINSVLEKMLHNHVYYKDRLDMFSQKLSDADKNFVLKKIEMSETNFQEKKLNNSILDNYAYPYRW